MNETHHNFVSNRVLKLQVGFLFSEGVGQSLDTEFDVPSLRVDDDLSLNRLQGTLHLSRTPQGILVQGKLKSSLDAECRRCLQDTTLPITISLEELFVSPPRPDAEFTIADDGILDLVPLIRQEIILAIPIGILCKPDCAGLCLDCGKNLNDGPCDCQHDSIDPRFAVLKTLKEQSAKN